MKIAYLALYIIVATCFATAVLDSRDTHSRVSLIAAGLYSWVMVSIVHTIIDLMHD